ncbi:hypothetical protein KJ567_04710 [Candidatus Bipolaricaulota bacterium]|nr:hypothetical protein [Candidatus Bipolaricaulota bacterium]
MTESGMPSRDLVPPWEIPLHRLVQSFAPSTRQVAAQGIRLYEAGHYEDALPRLEAVARESDDFARAARFLISRCHRVPKTTWSTDDFRIRAEQQSAGRTASAVLKEGWEWVPVAVAGWLRSNLGSTLADYRRCKHCGHYTRYIDPNGPPAYFGNRCDVCARSYPMPSVSWDSAYGRVSIYCRGSAMDRRFYEEFEADYP